MKLKVIACDVLTREVYHACAESPHVCEVTLIPFGLHDTPSKLRDRLQEEIDSADAGGCDAIALAYALCSRGTAGLAAHTKPIVIPRAHDCITLFLGSRERYAEEFHSHPGTYYYSAGWIEHNKDGNIRQGYISEAEEKDKEARLQEYIQKYGEDNAAYLLEMESQWTDHYSRAALIDVGLGDIERYRNATKRIAEERGWEYAELPGDRSLIIKLIFGEWDNDFLRVEPGMRIAESFDERIICALPVE